MSFDNMNLEELKELYEKKYEELEEMFNSSKFIWLKENEDIIEEYNKILIKYKVYYYSEKSFLLEIEMILNTLYKIKKILLEKYNFEDEKLLTKKFDKESIL